MLLKEIIDGKVLRASRSKRKKRYHYPNESVLLPLASWSSSSISTKLSAQASISTIRSQSRSVYRYSTKGPSQCTALPLTPPRSPSQPDHVDRSDLMTECAPTPDNVSLLTIEDKELPYSRLVSLTTPSLHLELGTLSLTFDFLQVLSGCLSIVQIEDNIALSRGYYIVEVENIPTTAELQMDCFHDSNELTFQLRTAQRGLVCISFVWEEDANGLDAHHGPVLQPSLSRSLFATRHGHANFFFGAVQTWFWFIKDFPFLRGSAVNWGGNERKAPLSSSGRVSGKEPYVERIFLN